MCRFFPVAVLVSTLLFDGLFNPIEVSIADAADVTDGTPQTVSPHSGVVVWWGGGEVPTAVFERLATADANSAVAVVASESSISPELTDWCHATNHPVEVVRPDTLQLQEKLLGFKAVWIDIKSLSPDSECIDQLLVSDPFPGEATLESLVAKLSASPGRVGVGIPARTALIAKGRKLEVVGESNVVFCLPSSITHPEHRPTKLLRNKPGSEVDLLELNRSAIARRGPEFPAREPVSPEVPHGALLACGGGNLSDEIWQRFIDLAGGTNSPIVVIPIAQPNPDDPNPKDLAKLKQLGCQRVKVLNQHTKADIQSPEFVEAMKEARGVWFVGGRQWKYIDAYEGTSEDLFHDVLKRNGVIGGSSAGAAVQAEYMVRGSPLGNREIMAEGYERGLNFLPGCAIDIHVAERGRLKDLVSLVQTFPQMLGIGIDEDTAVEVQGSVMTVIGKRKVNIVDSRTPEPLPMKSGDQYHLVTRQLLPEK